MQKYFISKEEFNNKTITSSDVNHIKNVMRQQVGDMVVVSNGENEYKVKFIKIDNKFVEFEIVEEIINNNELPFYVDIYQGYPKSDKMEDIIKHSTELGANEINPTFMKRSIVKLDDKKILSKEERFNKIAKEAAEQSNRKKVPTCKIYNLKNVDFKKYDHIIIAYEESAKNSELSNFKRIITSLKEKDKVAVIIGPEGGFDKEEITYLLNQGGVCSGLGPRILRTETAPLYVLSSISFLKELK